MGAESLQRPLWGIQLEQPVIAPVLQAQDRASRGQAQEFSLALGNSSQQTTQTRGSRFLAVGREPYQILPSHRMHRIRLADTIPA